MRKWIKKKILEWLNLDRANIQIEQLYQLNKDLVNIGVDVNLKEPHMIIVSSPLKGGQLRFIPTRFDSLKELNAFVKDLKKKYNTERTTFDRPSGMRDFIQW